MKKWNLIIDVAECTNCNLCTLATMDEHVGNDWPGYSAAMPRHGHKWINILSRERGQGTMIDIAYVPTMCNHCDDAPCVTAAEGGAVKKRRDGIVLIDPERARGQRQIVDACPYGHVWWNEEREIPQAWTFDAHLLDQGWKKPRGAHSCPTGAMQAVCLEDSEMRTMVERDGLEVLGEAHGTRPRVYYRNLYRYRTCFIGGSVSSESAGRVDCVAGARVTLEKDGERIGEAVTDTYGDFKFDRLDADSGAYTVSIEADGMSAKSVDVSLVDSINLGEIRL